jgi:hypothetical protein
VSYRAPRRPSATGCGRWAPEEASASSGGEQHDADGQHRADGQPDEKNPPSPSVTSLREEEVGIGVEGLRLPFAVNGRLGG